MCVQLRSEGGGRWGEDNNLISYSITLGMINEREMRRRGTKTTEKSKNNVQINDDDSYGGEYLILMWMVWRGSYSFFQPLGSVPCTSDDIFQSKKNFQASDCYLMTSSGLSSAWFFSLPYRESAASVFTSKFGFTVGVCGRGRWRGDGRLGLSGKENKGGS